MILTNIRNNKKDNGFTIVELLVVIVVIGVLAAITVVSYTGISNKAKASEAQSNASSIKAIIDSMVAESPSNTYPITVDSINNNTGVVKKPADITVISGNGMSAANGQTQIGYQCNSAVAATAPCLGTGGRIAYWDYNTNGIVYIYLGVATAASNFFNPAT